MVIIILMFIGGSSGSTAGGVKTTTIGVLLLTCLAVIRGHSGVNVFGRQIKRQVILRVLVILVISIVLVIVGTMLVLVLDEKDFLATLFEVVSAFGTVGLTMSLTPQLSDASLVILSAIMYLGRVGVMTAAFAIALRGGEGNSVRYPEGNVMVG